MIPLELKPHLKTTGRCLLCNSTNLAVFIKLEEFTVLRCRACGFRFANPYLGREGMSRLYDDPALLAETNPALEDYYGLGGSSKTARTQRDYERVLQTAESFLRGSREKLTMFEIGYGNGGVMREAARRGWETDGIDASSENALRLTRLGLKGREGSFEAAELPEGANSMMVLWDVIEHTDEPGLLVRKAYRMLSEGGLLVIATPNTGGLLNRLAEALYFLSFGKITYAVKRLYVIEHVGYFSSQTLRRLAENEGFRVKALFRTETDVDRYHFGGALKFLLSILFFCARLLGLENRVILMAEKETNA